MKTTIKYKRTKFAAEGLLATTNLRLVEAYMRKNNITSLDGLNELISQPKIDIEDILIDRAEITPEYFEALQNTLGAGEVIDDNDIQGIADTTEDLVDDSSADNWANNPKGENNQGFTNSLGL